MNSVFLGRARAHVVPQSRASHSPNGLIARIYRAPHRTDARKRKRVVVAEESEIRKSPGQTGASFFSSFDAISCFRSCAPFCRNREPRTFLSERRDGRPAERSSARWFSGRSRFPETSRSAPYFAACVRRSVGSRNGSDDFRSQFAGTRSEKRRGKTGTNG